MPDESMVWGEPDPAPPAPLPKEQAEAQAKIDAILADPGHTYHKGEDAAVQEVYRLYQARYPSAQPHGPYRESGVDTVFQTIGKQPPPNLTAAQAQAELDATYANKAHAYHKGNQDAADRVLSLQRIVAGIPVDATPDPNAAPATPGEAFIASHADLELSEPEAREWVAWAKTQPSGGTLQRALAGWPEDVHDEVAELADLGWKSLKLTLSARATAELHGLQYGARAFTALVKRGLKIRDEQEAEALKLAEERPGSAALNDPARRQR